MEAGWCALIERAKEISPHIYSSLVDHAHGCDANRNGEHNEK
jgi:hypothetical protein